jgi:hypothetical protein
MSSGFVINATTGIINPMPINSKKDESIIIIKIKIDKYFSFLDNNDHRFLKIVYMLKPFFM